MALSVATDNDDLDKEFVFLLQLLLAEQKAGTHDHFENKIVAYSLLCSRRAYRLIGFQNFATTRSYLCGPPSPIVYYYYRGLCIYFSRPTGCWNVVDVISMKVDKV